MSDGHEYENILNTKRIENWALNTEHTRPTHTHIDLLSTDAWMHICNVYINGKTLGYRLEKMNWTFCFSRKNFPLNSNLSRLHMGSSQP